MREAKPVATWRHLRPQERKEVSSQSPSSQSLTAPTRAAGEAKASAGQLSPSHFLTHAVVLVTTLEGDLSCHNNWLI